MADKRLQLLWAFPPRLLACVAPRRVRHSIDDEVALRGVDGNEVAAAWGKSTQVKLAVAELAGLGAGGDHRQAGSSLGAYQLVWVYARVQLPIAVYLSGCSMSYVQLFSSCHLPPMDAAPRHTWVPGAAACACRSLKSCNRLRLGRLYIVSTTLVKHPRDEMLARARPTTPWNASAGREL